MSPQGIKTRSKSDTVHFPGIDLVSKSTGQVKVPGTPGSISLKGWQKTVSSGHRRNPKTGKYDSGGPFFTVLFKPEINPGHVRLEGTGEPNRFRYDGPYWVPNLLATGDPSTTKISEDSSYLDTYGATAIKLVDPTDSNAEFGLALTETIKEGREGRISLPGIQGWKRRTEVLQAAGSEFLSAQFGWLPLISDLKDTHESIKTGNKIMENYQAASGTLVHREFAFDDIVTEKSEIVATARCSAGGGNVTEFRGAEQPITRTTKTTTRRWFSGSFTYHAGNSGNQVAKCLGIGSKFDKLFGLALSPDLLWELTPWSWALDWVTNAGDVIHNASAMSLAGLVMKYGYIMEETTTVYTYSMPDSGFKKEAIKAGGGPPPDRKYTICTKRRREANPFGFGVTWDGLSPTQLAITAALGITRL